MWLYEVCIHVCHRARLYCTTKGWVLKHLYVLGCIIGHYVVWVIRHSNMYMSETRLYHIVRECATELVTRHLCMNISKRFVYVHVTELGCIIGHICGTSNKKFVYEYVKRFVYVHITGLVCVTGNNVV